MTIGVTLLHVEGRGHVHANSPDPTAAPAIWHNMLSTETDRRTAVAGMWAARRLMEAEAGVGAAVGVGAGVKTRFGINPLDLIRQGAVKGMEQANVLVGTVEGWLRKLRGKE